jgi:hypothetical protein
VFVAGNPEMRSGYFQYMAAFILLIEYGCSEQEDRLLLILHFFHPFSVLPVKIPFNLLEWPLSGILMMGLFGK